MPIRLISIFCFLLLPLFLFGEEPALVIPLEIHQKIDTVMVEIAEEGLAISPEVVGRIVGESAEAFPLEELPLVAAAIVDRLPADAYWIAYAAVNLDPDNAPAIVQAMAMVRPEMARSIISGARFASPVQIHLMIVAMNDVLPPERIIPMNNDSFFTLKVPEPEQINPTETGSPGGRILLPPPPSRPQGSRPGTPPAVIVSPSQINP